MTDESQKTNEDQVADIVLFWSKRARVASEVHKALHDEVNKKIKEGAMGLYPADIPSPGDILQSMSLFELPGRIVGSYFETQRQLMEQVQKQAGNIVKPNGMPPVPPLQKGPRRKKR